LVTFTPGSGRGRIVIFCDYPLTSEDSRKGAHFLKSASAPPRNRREEDVEFERIRTSASTPKPGAGYGATQSVSHPIIVPLEERVRHNLMMTSPPKIRTLGVLVALKPTDETALAPVETHQHE
jgi:hypothetical protein